MYVALCVMSDLSAMLEAAYDVKSYERGEGRCCCFSRRS